MHKNNPNDIKVWHKQGVLNIATHLIIMGDGDGEPLDPYYVTPNEYWRDVQNNLEGGGHCWRVIDLMFPLSDKDITDFQRAILCHH